MKYPVFIPSLTDEDISYVTKSLKDGWISSNGPYITEFESRFSEYLGTKYATTVCNGTSALEVALASLGIFSGEVILPSFTIASCAYAIQRVGATPVFVDVDPKYFCLNPQEVEKHITNQTKCIMLVNMYGNTCDVDSFLDIQKKYRIPIVEDCSENLGGAYKKLKSGTQFDVSTFSLYANKTITSGEGGIVCTSSKTCIEKARRYKNLDFPSCRSFRHLNQAFNYRMASPLAALANSQLKRIDEILYEKNRIFLSYQEFINSNFLTPLSPRPKTTFVPWMNCFLVNESIKFNYSKFEQEMKDLSIQVRPFFSNLANQKCFSDIKKTSTSKRLPVTESIASRGFYLPSSIKLKVEDIKYISNKVNNYF